MLESSSIASSSATDGICYSYIAVAITEWGGHLHFCMHLNSPCMFINRLIDESQMPLSRKLAGYSYINNSQVRSVFIAIYTWLIVLAYK